ncbi:hypothetical protein GMORB2_3943 [Geosmithia morbida]|uniref:Transcription initiation factor IIA large subunit n=1 Tax=Geosmithia morbida TaxID=1094350 RepID=A0A9P5D828_9HYPO|nr:uncharacterized protein GMORB2_3943 [Geosmithia morbida]KAF4125104.1 hypothetical protein GMORB2_3943 [Geosmithia morbida]
MSNQAVGNVYQSIIDEVVNTSRVDFEESGVEDAVLEELRQGWQQKLSQLGVARFPWDPKPDPPAPPPQAPEPVPQQVAVEESVPQPNNNAQAQFPPQLPIPTGGAAPQQQNGGVKQEAGEADPGAAAHIKQEPGTAGGQMPPPMNFNSLDGGKNNVAASRAAQLVQKQYGERAVGSINAIQAGQQQQQQQQQQQSQQTPEAMQQAYRQQMAAATAQQQQGAANGQQQPHASQTDGAGDDDDDDDDNFEGVLVERNASGDVQELGRVEIDKMLHDRIAARAKSMEGGGLMVPLKEATRHRTATSNRSKGKGIAGHDGGDDDDEPVEADEDAINSDLDDPDEDRSEDEVDDEGLGHIMLCMYDKVQRVKNKWKCTLKDGVLTVNGKEYVFHKATGEYEW